MIPLVVLAPMLQEGPRLIVPKATWEPIFFGKESEPNSIRGRSRIADLSDLRRTLLPRGDVELRVWVGFGATSLEGLVFRRRSGRWAVDWLPAVPAGLRGPNTTQPILLPQETFQTLWSRMQSEGILEIRDDSELPPERSVRGGLSYVVEIQREGVYRTFMCNNPDRFPKRPDAKMMRRIARLIETALGMPLRRDAYYGKPPILGGSSRFDNSPERGLG